MYLTELDKNEISELVKSFNEPVFRAKQVTEWLNRGARPQEMSNLPKQLRASLSKIPYGGASIWQTYVSKLDGTKKYLFRLEDGNVVEGVLMRYRYGNTLCISTQVGCGMGCAFCASTLEGCVRDLLSGEMLSFIYEVEKSEPIPEGSGRVVTNVVLMGSGEPLANYDNVVRFLKRVTDAEGINISPRNISLSTSGLVPRIETLPDDAPHVTLSLSLHAASNEKRSKIMPINKAYPLELLIPAAKRYSERTGRRVIFEYALIGGFNDSREDAKQLSELLRNMRCHVNLIPLNPVAERNLAGVSRKKAEEFCEWLDSLHISATVRREMGSDIEGACGQLRRRVLE